MAESVAIIGAGVSGLTCGVVFAEHGHGTVIFAKEVAQQTTSGAAAAVWFPYDAEPLEKVIPWALKTFDVLADLARVPATGVSMIELRQFSRTREIQIPDWAIPLGAQTVIPSSLSVIPSSLSVIPSSLSVILSEVEIGAAREAATWTGRPEAERTGGERITSLESFSSGFSLRVPLMDTTIYLDYLANRFVTAGGSIAANVHFNKLEEVDRKFDLVINCAGIGARDLVQDVNLEPHRGQVVIVPKIENLPCAIVCDDAPLMYAIPRRNDCVFGGTNEISDDLDVDPRSTARILDECSRVLNIDKPRVTAERVGLRPFRKSGVRLERDQLCDGRTVIHNYGHGGAGFTLSWGCAREVLDTATL
ncbi:MAG TPA: FAD-dependent oxidoreductase [Candidatus Udaeobacter sp.]|nr:FAD-dependent oxidoreductase [Candidatus Udaeobacter sp.]